jgi:DNA polymerase-1
MLSALQLLHNEPVLSQRSTEFVLRAKATGSYAFDVEHPPELTASGPNFRLAGCGFATDGILFYETDVRQIEAICKALFPLHLDAVAYNGKYDLKCLTAVELISPYEYPRCLCDPMVAVNLLDDNRHKNEMGLKVVVWDEFGHEMKHFEESWEHGEHSNEFRLYAEDDVRQELRLWLHLKPKLVAESLDKLFHKILMPVTSVFADLEMFGVGWSIAGARKLLRGFQELRRNTEQEIYNEIGELNLNSGDQIAKRLFNELGYSTAGLEMTDSKHRVKTDASSMEKLANRYPICKKIVTYRTATKMINTYIEPLTRKALADPKGRIHPTVWIVSATGRTRMENPNFQNIPVWLILRPEFAHLNIRNNVIPAPGMALIVADLSQIELRICGHITQDPMFLKAFRDWRCGGCLNKGSESKILLHACPVCGNPEDEDFLKGKNETGFFHGKDMHQQTFDLVPATGSRQGAKTANFAVIYLATAARLNYEYPELSRRQWQEVINQFMRTYEGIHTWHLRMKRQMYDTGVCRDVFGRKRRILKRDIHANAKHAANMFVNFPVQSSACALIELIMSNLREHWMQSRDWLRTIFMSNFVHDEIVFECPIDLVDRYVPTIRTFMENCVPFSVPIRTDIQVVDKWGAAK